ncbi:glycosyltransferase family 2 protein [Mesobacillus subterraneus]|uniref:glycosyltransferase family 2 protein n=1 Tax=Mesobacillus subterraneus TaxID=285983 RepID=UPI00203F4919|nr:glycosyltransferase family 2 protein [Mesobacillus subterraneus]MCM3572118.1 glycosyltransferase family 2 protein [Mesobacillus subterraneus]
MSKVIVFLPAFNEEESIAEVIENIPRTFAGADQVEVLIIDDGSTDGTVAEAKKAGADHIISFEKNRGLGAAVRKGIEESFRMGADVGVMIDADGEYPAWQIPDIVKPILNGEADYTMGSRFMGTIKGMKFHRRMGNYCFTFLQTLLLRKWLYDGQSGMRAFSRKVLENAEIIHDYNYAQVLTLNLVRKGFRVLEVPIKYRVRTTGTSFISFKKYMTNVVPAVYREMSRPVSKVNGVEKSPSKNSKNSDNKVTIIKYD